MLRPWQLAIVSSLAVVLLGCPSLLKKKGEDAGADAGPAASASATALEAGPVAVASNDSDVTHYPDQTAANNEALTARMTIAARTEANNVGKLVAELRPGTECQKLADHEGYDLVVFPDPKDATQKLEGWVYHTAFVASAPAPTPAKSGEPACKPQPLNIHQTNNNCPAGYAKCGAGCRLACKTDAECCSPGVTCQAGLCGGACK
jgi:hypothetical protein